MTLSLVEAKGGENLLPDCRDFSPSQGQKAQGKKILSCPSGEAARAGENFLPECFCPSEGEKCRQKGR